MSPGDELAAGRAQIAELGRAHLRSQGASAGAQWTADRLSSIGWRPLDPADPAIPGPVIAACARAGLESGTWIAWPSQAALAGHRLRQRPAGMRCVRSVRADLRELERLGYLNRPADPARPGQQVRVCWSGRQSSLYALTIPTAPPAAPVDSPVTAPLPVACRSLAAYGEEGGEGSPRCARSWTEPGDRDGSVPGYRAAGPAEIPDSSPMVDVALAHAARGLRVLPLHNPVDGRCSCSDSECGSPAKHPRIRSWQSEATTDPDRIREWWARWPSANVGLVCGDPGGLAVLDVDGDAGDASLARLAAEHGELPVGPVTITGLGRHYWFVGGGMRTTSARPTGDPMPGLDTRGGWPDGSGLGYVLAPGSVHARGVRYRLLGGHLEVPEAPAWLVDAIATRTTRSAPPAPRPTRRWWCIAPTWRPAPTPVIHRSAEATSPTTGLPDPWAAARVTGTTTLAALLGLAPSGAMCGCPSAGCPSRETGRRSRRDRRPPTNLLPGGGWWCHACGLGGGPGDLVAVAATGTPFRGGGPDTTHTTRAVADRLRAIGVLPPLPGRRRRRPGRRPTPGRLAPSTPGM